MSVEKSVCMCVCIYINRNLCLIIPAYVCLYANKYLEMCLCTLEVRLRC